MRHVVFFILFINLSFSQQNDIFIVANEKYNSSDFVGSIEKYNELLIKGFHSPELYFNLGNAYYKLDSLANSIYYYEKALKLDPNDIDTLNNLAYTQNMLIDKIDVLPSNQLSNILINISNFLSINQWLSFGIISIYIFLILFIFYFLKRDSNSKKNYFTFSSILFCISIVFIVTGVTKFENQKSNTEAIIFDKKIDFRTEPNYRSDVQFNLHEGTKVKLKEELGDWVLVELSNGASGWVELNSIKKID